MVIQQNSRKRLMMDILMSETCWAHKKWNKIASDIKLVFYFSTTIILFHVMYKMHIICNYSYTYLFLFLRSVFLVARMQTKLYRSFPRYIKLSRPAIYSEASVKMNECE